MDEQLQSGKRSYLALPNPSVEDGIHQADRLRKAGKEEYCDLTDQLIAVATPEQVDQIEDTFPELRETVELNSSDLRRKDYEALDEIAQSMGVTPDNMFGMPPFAAEVFEGRFNFYHHKGGRVLELMIGLAALEYLLMLSGSTLR